MGMHCPCAAICYQVPLFIPPDTALRIIVDRLNLYLDYGTYTNSSVIVRLSLRQFDHDLCEFDDHLRQS
jgi:hypothetical protein